MLRASRLLAATGVLAASALAVSACGPVHAGAAATVGSERISVNAVKAGADTMLKDTGTSASASSDNELQRKVLSRLITDELLDRAAEAKGVSVAEGDVQNELSTIRDQTGGEKQLEAAAAGQGIAADDVHDYVYYALLKQKLGAELTKDATVQTAHLAVIVVQDQATADKVLAEVGSDTSKFADAAKKYSLDTNTGANGGDIGSLPVEGLPEPLKTDVTSKDIGAIFEETIQGSFYVVWLKSLDTTKVSDLQGSQSAQQAQDAAVQQYLSSLSASDKVVVSPRYGAWDPQSLTVVASTGKLSTPAASSG